MSQRRSNFEKLPPGLLPRNMNREEAAAYCRLPQPEFDRRVESGSLPAAVFTWGQGNKVWDRDALDAALDRLSGIDRPRGTGNDSEGGDDPFLAALR
jgi:hypothetical protein